MSRTSMLNAIRWKASAPPGVLEFLCRRAAQSLNQGVSSWLGAKNSMNRPGLPHRSASVASEASSSSSVDSPQGHSSSLRSRTSAPMSTRDRVRSG